MSGEQRRHFKSVAVDTDPGPVNEVDLKTEITTDADHINGSVIPTLADGPSHRPGRRYRSRSGQRGR